jgi:hypothetical protein
MITYPHTKPKERNLHYKITNKNVKYSIPNNDHNICIYVIHTNFKESLAKYLT